MMKKWFGTLLAFSLLLVLTGCDAGESSNPGGCGPDTCPTGCCDPTTNICQTGMAQTACGMNGNLCLACTGGTTCNAQTRVCEVGSTGCNCPGGCCTAQGVCVQSGNYPTACGTDGLTCKVCVGTQQCVNGQCQEYNPTACNTTNCPTGCCNGDQCQPYPNASQCGTNAAPCQPCPTGFTCNTQTGQCQDPNGCGASCTQQNGCCLNNQCQAGTHPLACGGGGQICDTCDQTEVCDPATKTCKPATTTGDCSPTNCFSGCCDRDGRCHIDGAINEQFCGALGLGCETCQTWEECTWGSCDPKQTSCSCGVGQCCKDGQCVAGNTTTQCGTNGAICDNCFLKLPPTTCNTTTYTCTGGGSTNNCVGCASNECCDVFDECVTGTWISQCGGNGNDCQNCGTESCTWSSAASNYTCTGTTGDTYKICLDRIVIDCPLFPDCVDDSINPTEIYAEFTMGGSTIESAYLPFDKAGGEQTLSSSWCSTQSYPASDFSNIAVRVMENDIVGDDPIASCTVTLDTPTTYPLVLVCTGGLSLTLRSVQ